SLGEARDVRAELALDDLALFARVHELDGILETDDIESSRRVEVVDHVSQRARLAGTGQSDYQHHALVVVAELGDDRRQCELFERRNRRRNRTESGADAGLLAVHVDSETAAFGGHVGEVEVVALAELLVLRSGKNLRN